MMTPLIQIARVRTSLSLCVGLLLVAAAAWAQDPFAQLLAAAEEGNPNSQLRLGVAYATGEGAPRNGIEAVRWLERAESTGGKTGAAAAGWLGVIHERGMAVRRNGEAAVRWYTRGAELGAGASAQNLAELYLGGSLVKKNETLGLHWYGRAASLYEVEATAGDNNAAYQAARIYRRGMGVPVDRDRAITLFEQASRSGHADATKQLADIRAEVRKELAAAERSRQARAVAEAAPLRLERNPARKMGGLLEGCGELVQQMHPVLGVPFLLTACIGAAVADQAFIVGKMIVAAPVAIGSQMFGRASEGAEPSSLPLHGNWCGPGHPNSERTTDPPIDELDHACYRHDKCYDRYGYYSCRCDVELIHAIRESTSMPEDIAAKAELIAAYFEKSYCMGCKQVRSGMYAVYSCHTPEIVGCKRGPVALGPPYASCP